MRARRTAIVGACALLAVGGLAACGSDKPKKLDSADQVVEVLPSRSAMGGGWKAVDQNPLDENAAGTPAAFDAATAGAKCRTDLRIACGGLTWIGAARYAGETEVPDATFTVYAFTDQKAAQAVMDAVLKGDRSDPNMVQKNVKTSPLGDDCKGVAAWEHGKRLAGLDIVVRTGTVVSRVHYLPKANAAKPYDEAMKLAARQNDRLDAVLDGKHPDS